MRRIEMKKVNPFILNRANPYAAKTPSVMVIIVVKEAIIKLF